MSVLRYLTVAVVTCLLSLNTLAQQSELKDFPELQAIQTAGKQMLEIERQFKETIDADASLAPLRSKMVLYRQPTTPTELLVNEAKPTGADKKLMLKLMDLADEAYVKQLEAVRSGMPSAVQQIFETGMAEVKATRLDLYKGKMTFGDANTKVADLLNKTNKEMLAEASRFAKSKIDARKQQLEATDEAERNALRLEHQRKMQQVQQEQVQAQQQARENQQMKLVQCQNAIRRVEVLCQRSNGVTVNVGTGYDYGNAAMAGANFGTNMLSSLECAKAQGTAERLCR